jgi:hypothetical protein
MRDFLCSYRKTQLIAFLRCLFLFVLLSYDVHYVKGTCKKGYRFCRHSCYVTFQTLPGLLSDIPAGDRETSSLFLQCRLTKGPFSGAVFGHT